MPFAHLFIDLDGTVYPKENGIWEAITTRINEFMESRLNIPAEGIPALRRAYFEEYGTTLRGLIANHPVEPEEYLAYAHDIPLGDYLRPDPELRAALLALPQPKWILTNSDRAHTERVLGYLGIGDLFSGILDAAFMDYENKFNPAVYQKALHAVGESEPANCLMADDIPHNLQPARDMGFFTVLVGETEPNAAARLSIARLHDLPAALATQDI